MKKRLLVTSLILLSVLFSFSQKKITEGTIVYNLTVNSDDPNPKMIDGLDGATNTVYIKGKMSRTEFVSIYGVQSTIIDKKTGHITLLKEFGEKKFMINLEPTDWTEMNKQYDSISFSYGNETKSIAGYNCKKAVGTLKTGETFTVYYTTELVPENQEFQYSNRSLPGLALQYETTYNGKKAVYTASTISFNPVPIAKFDLPKNGFRVMSYEESKKSVNN